MRYLLLRLKRFCGFITGFIFFLSGIFKLLDPVGAGLVMEEYFNFLHVDFMAPAAKITGTLLALTETVLGAGLITGVWRRIIAPAAIAIQGFFTLVTLLLVIFNPQMDCGCFGEVIHLTHMETFVKNILMLVLLLTYYIPAKHLGKTRRRKYVSFSIVLTSVFLFTIYSWMHIPLTDFTDFKPAAALQAGNAFGTPQEDMYEAVFLYEKDGQQQAFTLGHLPDTTWTFVSTETRLKEGYDNSLVNLSFHDSMGRYQDSLATIGKVMVISLYDTDMKASQWARTAALIIASEEQGFTPVTLFSGKMEDIPEELRRTAFHADRKTLLSLNRANGGATFFNDGFLIRKWSARSLPDRKELKELYEGDATETIIGHSSQSSLIFQSFLLYVFAVMLLL
ncbi:MAG: DoxX family membrane protein [Bacteroidales bacterium]|nr:DoxX family membrane protein [Bacteroidales bacterium]